MNQREVNRDLIRRLEIASAEAMPSLSTRFYDGWLLRFAGGYTRRANSIHPLYSSSLPLDEKIQQCESLYERIHLPVVFKLTEASHPADLEARLIGRGYTADTSVNMQTLMLETMPAELPAPGSPRLTDVWFAAYTSMNKTPAVHHATLRAMLQKILHHTWYALLKDEENKPIAAGLVVLDNSLMGIFDVVVTPEKRQQGIGTKLMQSLLAYGKTYGAKTAYLQVSSENTAGLRLYQRLGFRDAYRYWYRVKSTK